jgi:hypothetical protein
VTTKPKHIHLFLESLLTHKIYEGSHTPHPLRPRNDLEMGIRYTADTLREKATDPEHTLLIELCNTRTAEKEHHQIETVIAYGRYRLHYGPDKRNVLHIAVIHGNKKQLKVYRNLLPEGQWQILRSTEDIRGMTPVAVAKHIVENIRTGNWAEIKRSYYCGESEEFWQDFDFDTWVEYCEWFLNPEDVALD